MDSGFFMAVIVIAVIVFAVISILGSSIKRDEAAMKSESDVPEFAQEELVTISQYSDLIEAEAMQMKLKSADIESSLENEYDSAMISLDSPLPVDFKLQVKKSDVVRAQEVIKGKAELFKKKTEYTYKLEQKGEKYEPVLIYKQEFIYGANGKITEDMKFDADNQTPARRFYKYDEQGRLISEESFYEGVGLFHKVIYKYNEQGKIIEEISSPAEDKFAKKTRYEYDEKGRLSYEKFYSAGSVPSSAEKLYDDAGNLIQEIFYEGAVVCGKRSYRYNNEGKVIEESSYDDVKGPLIEKRSYFYGDNRLLKEVHAFNANGEVYLKTLYRYDEKGEVADITDFHLDEDHKEIPMKMVEIKYEFNNDSLAVNTA
jgi:hypothetical protein